MTQRALTFSLLLAALAMGTAPVSAQDDASPAVVSDASQRSLEEGIEAFRDDRFDIAKAAFERAIEKDGTNAEAYYMLSRVYYESPLFDKGEAGRSIRQARKLDPDNIEYMVAELQQLRLPSWNNLAELIQQQQRRAIAEQILSVDSTNAFAHEELGASFIRDFWQYRNAIALPTLDLARSELNRTDENGLGFEAEGQLGSQTLFEDPEAASSLETRAAFGDADAIDLTDRFDVAKLQAQGAGVLDLSSRADAAYAAAIGHLEKALQYDPRRRPVYDHLMRIHTLNEAYAEALGVLERMYIFFPEDPQTWAYLGLANQRIGRSDAAAKSFEEAFEFMSAEERADFDDLTLILNDDDQQRYAEDPVGFASRFWTSQNPRYLTPFNERKLEHYARLVHADLLYAAPEIDLRGWHTQRGRLLVRYGPPLSDVTMTGDFGEVITGFGLNVAAQEVESGRQFGERFDMADRSNLFNVWDYGDFKFVFEDPLRNGEYRLYSPPADFFADVSAGFVEKMDYEMIARETFRETPERYEYRPPGRDVRIPYVVTTFKGEGGQADLYVHYGIPLGESADLSGDLVPLTVKTGAFLINDDRDITVERRRTLYGLKTSQVVSFEEATLWTDTQPMTAAPGPATVSVEFETAGGGAEAAQRRTVDVPDFGGDRLAVSDLMLAYQVEEDFEAGENGVSGGRVRRGDVIIQPAPWSVFSNEQPIYLYFETYNLDENAEGQNQYAVEVTLKPKDTSSGIAKLAKNIFGGDDGGVSVEFEAGGTGPDDATYTILDAAGQEPGLYTLTLRVRDTLTGRTAERTSDLYLE
ncbi:MAG: GWxTD domain-containing protein [Rhodothermales bacterium]